MSKELIQAAAGLFPSLDHWQSFIELANQKEVIIESWFTEATHRIRNHFTAKLSPEWAFKPWGAQTRDTRWFLREFGSDSVAVTFAWHYRLDLRLPAQPEFNPAIVTKLLNESEFGTLRLAFERNDLSTDSGAVLMEIGNFKFGHPLDGSYSPKELSWYASHEIDSFVEQAVAKIERFTNNPEVTALIRKLNAAARNEFQAIIAAK